MWAMAVVILFPFFELGFDVDVIYVFYELPKLLFIRFMRPFDLTVEMR